MADAPPAGDRSPTAASRSARLGPWAVLAAPFALMLVVRTLAGPGLSLDDGEWLVKAQLLQRGYDLENPPLVIWLGWLWTQLLGVSPAAIWALRAALLLLAASGFYATARLAGAPPWRAAAAGLAPFTLFQVGWVPLVAYSHSVLLLAAMAWSVTAVLWLARQRGAGGYFLLAGTVSVGLLAKYNFAVFLAGLLAGAAADRQGRAWLGDRRALAVGAAALLLALPHGLWLRDHLPDLLTQGLTNLGRAPGADSGALAGFGAFARSLAMFALPGLLALAPAAALGVVRRGAAFGGRGPRVLAVQAALTLVLLAATAVAVGTRSWPAHYLYPLAGATVACALAAPRGRAWTGGLLMLAAVVPAVGLAGLAGDRPSWPPGAPQVASAASVAPLVTATRAVRTGDGPVVVQAPPAPPLRGTLAGALRVGLTRTPVLTTRWPLLRPAVQPADGCTLVWTGDRLPAIAPPSMPDAHRAVVLRLPGDKHVAGEAAFWQNAAGCRTLLARVHGTGGPP